MKMKLDNCKLLKAEAAESDPLCVPQTVLDVLGV
jgi:hypothetical protein